MDIEKCDYCLELLILPRVYHIGDSDVIVHLLGVARIEPKDAVMEEGPSHALLEPIPDSADNCSVDIAFLQP